MKPLTRLFLVVALAFYSVNLAAADKPYDNTFFGHLNFALQYTNSDNGSDWAAQDHFTRFGFKGYVENDIGVQAYYHIEGQVRMTGSLGKPLLKRNMGIGLRGDFGDFFMGRNDLPSKKVQQKVDLFSDLDADVLFSFDGDRRQADIFMYKTPRINNITTYIALKDEESQPSLDIDGWSAAILYEGNRLGLAYGQCNDIRIKGLVSHRASVQYKYNNWQFGTLLQESDRSGDREWGYVVSAKYQVGNDAYKVQFTESDIYKLGIVKSIRFSEQFSIGWDRIFTKHFSIYARTTFSTIGETQESDKLLGLGLILKF
jgi:hypothetical protein